MTARGWAGLATNVLLRLTILYFLAEVLLNPDDPRFAGKAIGPRNLVVFLVFGSLLPALFVIRGDRPWRAYPSWLDNLYLSIFWLDMAGNSFDLYNRYYYFDLIPHLHGTGAATMVVYRLFQTSGRRAIGLANGLHGLLELQEILTDVIGGTRNVRGPADSVLDLLVGALGSGLYLGLAHLMARSRREEGGREGPSRP